MDVNIEPSWKTALAGEFDKDYFKELRASIQADYLIDDPVIYPPEELIFNAFTLCPFENVKVVILGQDPYHGSGQAQGLSFSVPDGMKIPPSLQNIYKEINADIGTKIPTSGNLEHWAKQGVLLLNATMTVQASTPGSHQGLGWETFTDEIIKTISDQKEHVVFLLWGAYAGAKTSLINESKHLILKAPHPSPLSAHRGFLGCKHFSKTNLYLKEKNITEIIW